MVYRILADLVVLTHLAFILFVLFGGLLVLRWHWIFWAHIPAAGWGFMIEITGRICPLTPLENWLRNLGGAAGYTGGFVERYLIPVIYPAELTREIQLVLGGIVVLVNLAVYIAVWRRYRSSTNRKPTPAP
jgi:hypothetical protein